MHCAYKTKKQLTYVNCFLWCAGRDSPSLPGANTDWPCLERKALAAKNSVPHCFIDAATLTGSRPFITKKQKTRHPKGYRICLVRWKGLEPLTP